MKHDAWLCGVSLASISDSELVRLSREAGRSSLVWKQRFLGTLPELARRDVVPRPFKDVHHFACVIGGCPRNLVNEVLRVHRALEGMPRLREMLERGSVPFSRIKAVCPVVTSETDALWAERVSSEPRRVLEALVRELVGRSEAARRAESEMVASDASGAEPVVARAAVPSTGTSPAVAITRAASDCTPRLRDGNDRE